MPDVFSQEMNQIAVFLRLHGQGHRLAGDFPAAMAQPRHSGAKGRTFFTM